MEIKFVDVKYKNIFKSLNLKIQGNQITSIVGKNCSGKTSLLNLIYGKNLDFSGEIVFDDINNHNKITKNNIEKLRKSIFYIPQDISYQLFNSNILEDIKCDFLEENGQLKMNIINEYLNLFDLNKEILKKNYSNLSNCEQKKLLIIMMVISDRKVLLLDDPTLYLDYKSIGNLIKILKKEKSKGKIIILTSMDTEFLLDISDNIFIIDNTNIIKKVNKYDFFENKQLINKCGLSIPNIVKFKIAAQKNKKIKLMNRNNINDLIKDIYRNAK